MTTTTATPEHLYARPPSPRLSKEEPMPRHVRRREDRQGGRTWAPATACECTYRRYCRSGWNGLDPETKKAWLRRIGLAGPEHAGGPDAA